MIRYLTPVTRRDANGLVARVYDGLEREFGIQAEPITLHSPVPDLLAGAWVLCREVMVADGEVDRAAKERLAVSVSESNRCPYCVDAHASMLRSLAAAPVAAMPSDHPELLATELLFQYINRPVNVFLDESPFPTRRLHGLMVSVAGRRFRPFTRTEHPPGASLDLLPPADLPPDLGWAGASPHVGGAVARFAAAVERAGEVVPPAVRAWLEAALPGGPGKAVDDAVGELDAEHRTVGRLALLTAQASYRVTAEEVRGLDDRQLLGTVAWAAFAAARRLAVDSALARSS